MSNKKLLHTKRRVKRKLLEWEKIFENHTSDKRAIAKIHENSKQLNSKKIIPLKYKKNI
jgi:hypothetical protein